MYVDKVWIATHMKNKGNYFINQNSIYCSNIIYDIFYFLWFIGLFHENSKLMEEKRELKKLYSKDKEVLESKVRNLEMQLEELRETYEKQLEEKKVN